MRAILEIFAQTRVAIFIRVARIRINLKLWREQVDIIEALAVARVEPSLPAS